MSEVKTYAVNCNDAWLNTEGDDISDSYVKYADYMELSVQLANAERKCRELVAENVTLNDKMNRLATWPGIEFYSSAWEFCNLDGNDALEFMCDVKTPAPTLSLLKCGHRVLMSLQNYISHWQRMRIIYT